MTEIDRAQLAALDASGMHNTGRIQYEYGEFDTVKDDGCELRQVTSPFTSEQGWECRKCDVYFATTGKPKCRNIKQEATSLIQQRSETHGDFSVNSQVSQAIKRAIRTPKKYMELHDFQKEALDHIAGKIGRVIAGDAEFSDHWADIAGYAELVRERLTK